ncbi:hypothetical protein PS723_01205 [Pseudomonas fluorescens]|uniref:Uncharacterized protein n=1 Tax=Pseudomonas fluorescens TaxID=294 RepID=A0A5E7AWF2_PSEFL|nr:hypothetical protein PS723_01205 [Pseudomonas fluorescens]
MHAAIFQFSELRSASQVGTTHLDLSAGILIIASVRFWPIATSDERQLAPIGAFAVSKKLGAIQIL